MRDDPFPRERVQALLSRLGPYARLAWRLVREPLLSRGRRAAIAAAAAYLISPIDAVPGIIPVIGQLDDLAVALLAIRFALAGLDAERRRAHLGAVGLREDDLATDLATVGATGSWLVRAAGRTAAAGLTTAAQGVRSMASLARGAVRGRGRADA